MAILQQQSAGYNPHRDVLLEKLSWKLMDLGYGGVPRYAVMDRVADAVRTIQAVAADRIDLDDLSAFWQQLGSCLFELGGEPAAVRTVKRPILDPPTDGDDVCGADIPYLVSA